MSVPAPNSHSPPSSPPEDLPEVVAKKAIRKLKAERKRAYTVWYGLGMSGVVGWAIALPTVMGLFLGRWTDEHWPSPYSWTLMGLFVGVLLGSLNAWFWVQRER